MTKTLFIASAEPYSGKSVIRLGLINMLLGKAQRVGYFKPILDTDPKEKRDTNLLTVIEHFALPLRFDDVYALSRHEAMQHIENGTQGEMIDIIISKFKKLEENYDFTILEGSDFIGEGAAFEFESNILIAKNLAAPAVLVVSGENKTTAQVIHVALNFLRIFEAREIQVLSIIANKVAHGQVDDVKQLLGDQLPINTVLSVIPADKGLQNPTMKDIFQSMGGTLLFGAEHLSNQVDNFVTGAMQLPNFLNHIKENVLIVTPGDRGDIIVGSLQANLSASYPKVAGIILTAGSQPEEPVNRLIEGLQNVVPIISVQTPTFETITQIASIKARISLDNVHKIQLAIDTFNKYVDVQALEKSIVTYQSDAITPHMFQYQLSQWAKKQVKHIVLPEGNEDRILKAAARLIAQDIVTLTLLGNPANIAASVKRLGLDIEISKVRIIDPANSDYYDDYAETLYELRKEKDLTMEMARDLMTDVSYFGTMMVYKGHADGMVSGAVHTTQHTIRPALQFVKTKPGISTVSSVFFMCLDDRVSVFGDCAVNPNPTAEQLAEIAVSSADTSKRFGIEPRIAMLSYSSGSSGAGADVEKVRRATELVKIWRPDLKVEGPIQYDAAVDPEVGKQKLPALKLQARQVCLFSRI